MSDVLAEERPTRLGSSVTVRIARVAKPADSPDSMKQRLVDFEGGQVEHPPVATGLTERCVDSLGRQTVGVGRNCRHAVIRDAGVR